MTKSSTNHAGASYLVFQRKLAFMDEADDVCLNGGSSGRAIITLGGIKVQNPGCMAYVDLNEGTVLQKPGG